MERYGTSTILRASRDVESTPYTTAYQGGSPSRGQERAQATNFGEGMDAVRITSQARPAQPNPTPGLYCACVLHGEATKTPCRSEQKKRHWWVVERCKGGTHRRTMRL